MIGAGWSCGAAVAAPAPDQQVAYNAFQIPAGWTAMAPPGTCIANPWSKGCPPVKNVTYPSDATLKVIDLPARLGAHTSARNHHDEHRPVSGISGYG
jgi:hypothetical protein